MPRPKVRETRNKYKIQGDGSGMENQIRDSITPYIYGSIANMVEYAFWMKTDSTPSAPVWKLGSCHQATYVLRKILHDTRSNEPTLYCEEVHYLVTRRKILIFCFEGISSIFKQVPNRNPFIVRLNTPSSDYIDKECDFIPTYFIPMTLRLILTIWNSFLPVSLRTPHQIFCLDIQWIWMQNVY